MSFEPKKMALIRILEILQRYSDEKQPLMQEDIANKLMSEYGIEIERKAIGRNVSLLKEAGYEIVSDRRGSYLTHRTFEDSELRMLIDGVLTSKYINENHSKQLIEKLSSLSNVYFKSHIKNVYSVGEWSKTDNCALFYNIEIIDEAIENNKQITFIYNKYGTDKKLHKSAPHKVSPYQMTLHNQRYYLMAADEYWKNVSYYRLDRITDIAITDEPATNIRSMEGYNSGINYREMSALPYMFSDKSERVEFLASEGIVDQIIDWLGLNVRFGKAENGKVKVTARISPNAMEYWAMQYINHVEIVSPASLRERIKANLQAACQKYNA